MTPQQFPLHRRFKSVGCLARASCAGINGSQMVPSPGCRAGKLLLTKLPNQCLSVTSETIIYVHIKEPETARSGLQIHHYNTRHAKNYRLPVHRLIGAKMWNALPDVLKNSNKQLFT
ncbi:hypothetical protein J6590_038859 [Homalodisca vitripennis]|nr:hypothetical protein J6590_038859 [Homalodisca vitripennis]